MSIHQEKNICASFELRQGVYKYLMGFSAEDKIGVNEIVDKALCRYFDDREERIDAEIVDRANKEIAEHGTISFEDWQKTMGI